MPARTKFVESDRPLIVHALVAGFEEADATTDLLRRHRGVGDAPLIDERQLFELVQCPGERALDEPAAVPSMLRGNGQSGCGRRS